MVISGIGFAHYHSDYSVFVRWTKFGSMILVVYVDVILLTGSGSVVLTETQEYLIRHSVTKDMGSQDIFLRLKLLIKSMIYFYLRGSIHLISLRKLTCYGANLLAL